MKVIESLEDLFLPHLGRIFPTGGKEEELKPFKFERNMRALRRSPRRARKD